jgi:iron complex transport system ATP-binding protein
MMNVLTATDLVVRRGHRMLLDHVSLSLAPGRVTVIIGPNGAGKSTLLRILSGELPPDSGTVALLDQSLSSWPAASLARIRSVLPQESDLNFPFRVEEVVRLGRIPHPGGGDSSADHALARAALAQVDLSAFADRLYPTLSGGEKQRVHLARALTQLQPDPGAPTPTARVLLLDEPTASLDLTHQHSVLTLARNLAVREQVTVLAVLHDLNLALTYADDLVILSGGRVAAAGPLVETLTPALIRSVFHINATCHPAAGDSPAHLSFGALPHQAG